MTPYEIAKKIALKDGSGVLLLFEDWDELPIDIYAEQVLVLRGY